MAIKITDVKLTPQTTTVGHSVLVEIKVGENTWESVIADYATWQDVKDGLLTWQDIYNI
jgi:hypothetical protein